MIVRTLSAAFLSLALTFPAIAQTRYISDDLYVFMHAGPSNQFRIVGSVNAGTKINQTDYNAENKYAKIVLEGGREGWVEAKYLNRSPGLANQLEQIKTQLEKSETARKQQLEDSGNASSERVQQIETQQQQIEQLQVNNDQLNEQLNQITNQNAAIQHELDTKDEAVQMQWFMRGAGVAAAGLVLGILLPMIPRRKKRDNQWM
ncbi:MULTISPECIES: TIGR04211 family SH3 domain-containing protein [unclassified Agarivorans]|uniref:TIGR04211 family SH3 domain-containing protein n=1 Tax=unclassified Agarivorans TaxID=2636026 RepID=UPI0010EA6C58|nr:MULTISPECIES: TIGR04211 family SH3 domain-containing protein [unclassified Agarivorans]MDO6685249.1 TIGR04211 family SH3 domain-containing protein [Agarivorans sp. 3_MG-2023]MDO6715579.1 TIGR04211 family SH3 domain-containing protein [Agarivorans sp. 2_MG-2023]MDO6763726.1 TIGR04211 family SH3 domain-containing protein [Agarivorans sp. 1_MG-2023]GDY27154.1 signal transduction protein [Agarivorans sp. Toyoura001]